MRRLTQLAGTVALMAFAFLTFLQAPARAGEIEIRRKVEYARHDGVSLLGDLYAPKEAGTHPAIIAVHGGGWQQGSTDSYKFLAPWLAERGYVVLAVTYRFSKPGTKMFPESVNDVRAAIQFLRARAAEMKVDPDRIGLIGDSAGAHLVALVGLAGDHPTFASANRDDPNGGVSARVKAVVAAYGIYDMAQQWNHDVLNRPTDNIVEKYLGVAPADDRKLYFDASPMSYTTKANKAVSFLLANGTEDDVVDRWQTDSFFLALKQSGNYVRRFVMQGQGHYWLSDPIDEAGSVSGYFAPRLLRFLADRL